jgi:hypothetical protein
MLSKIYLNFDGVLHPRIANLGKGILPRLLHAGNHRLFEHCELFASLLRPHPEIEIVLHTWWITSVGYIGTLRQLPVDVQSHIAGATIPGTRHFRFHNNFSRREWLRRDLVWRRPMLPILVDSDPSQALPDFETRSFVFLHADGIADARSERTLKALIQCLTDADKDRSP